MATVPSFVTDPQSRTGIRVRLHVCEWAIMYSCLFQELKTT